MRYKLCVSIYDGLHYSINTILNTRLLTGLVNSREDTIKAVIKLSMNSKVQSPQRGRNEGASQARGDYLL